MSTHQRVHSTGRGGAGNIGQDNRIYTDGAIVREGVAGVSQSSEYSTGRGGAGNIESPRVRPTKPAEDIIPEISTQPDYENYHTGRGGGGNVHKEKYGGHSHDPNRETLGQKVMHALHLEGNDKHHGDGS